MRRFIVHGLEPELRQEIAVARAATTSPEERARKLASLYGWATISPPEHRVEIQRLLGQPLPQEVMNAPYDYGPQWREDGFKLVWATYLRGQDPSLPTNVREDLAAVAPLMPFGKVYLDEYQNILDGQGLSQRLKDILDAETKGPVQGS